MVKIIVNTVTKEKRYAVLKNEQLINLSIEQPTEETIVGNIYYGTVKTVIPGMNAAFINIGQEKNGFLHCSQLPEYVAREDRRNLSISNLVHEGEKILVQVTKDATQTKGSQLTAIIELQDDLLVYLPFGNYVAVSKKIPEQHREQWRQYGEAMITPPEGLILRTACKKATKQAILDQLNFLRTKFTKLTAQTKNSESPALIMQRDNFFSRLVAEINSFTEVEVVVDELTLKHELDQKFATRDLIKITLATEKEQRNVIEQLDEAVNESLKRIVWLKNGAYLIFDETEALTVVDVNTGKYVGKSNLRTTILQVNELALREFAKQVQLRNYGGIILLDLINMRNEKDRNYILQLAKDLFVEDDKRSTIIGFTRLGILQMTRKKTTASLGEVLTINCPTCQGKGKVLSPEAVAFQLERLLWQYRYNDAEAVLIEATEDVIKLYSAENEHHHDQLEEKVHFKIYFREVNECHPQFAIRQFGTETEIVARLQ